MRASKTTEASETQRCVWWAKYHEAWGTTTGGPFRMVRACFFPSDDDAVFVSCCEAIWFSFPEDKVLLEPVCSSVPKPTTPSEHSGISRSLKNHQDMPDERKLGTYVSQLLALLSGLFLSLPDGRRFSTGPKEEEESSTPSRKTGQRHRQHQDPRLRRSVSDGGGGGGNGIGSVTRNAASRVGNTSDPSLRNRSGRRSSSGRDRSCGKCGRGNHQEIPGVSAGEQLGVELGQGEDPIAFGEGQIY